METQLSRRAIAARINGAKGGRATANNHTEEWLRERARKAGETTRVMYSNDFFRFANSLRRTKRGWTLGKMRKAVDRVSQELANANICPESAAALQQMLTNGQVNG